MATIIFAFAAALFGSSFALTIYLQEGLGRNPQQTGLITFTQAIGVLAGAQLASRFLYPKFGPRRLTSVALLGYTMFVASLVFVEPGVSLWWLRLQLLAMGVCMGNVFVPVQATAFAQISGRATGQASALFNTLRQIGGALGVALVYTIISEVGPFTGSARGPVVHIAAFRWAFLASALVIALTIPVALRIRDDLAAATIVARPGKSRVATPVVGADAEIAAPAPAGNDQATSTTARSVR